MKSITVQSFVVQPSQIRNRSSSLLVCNARRLYNFSVKPKLQHRVGNSIEDKRPLDIDEASAERGSHPTAAQVYINGYSCPREVLIEQFL